MDHLNRRDFLKSSAVLLAQRTGRPPNIVWILADDLGYSDIGCYGQKIIRTPNIDHIAAEGMRFTNAYAGCTVCAPSRNVLMTGMHAGHITVRSNPPLPRSLHRWLIFEKKTQKRKKSLPVFARS